MSNGVNYAKVFNRICHIVALKQDGKLKAAIDGLVLTAFAYDADLAPSDGAELRQAIEVLFGIDLKITDVQNAIDYNLQLGYIQRQNGTLLLSPAIKAEYLERIEEANKLEEIVRSEWLQQIAQIILPKPENWESQLWRCLTSYMARTFHQHGVQTIQLLNPSLPLDDDDLRSLQSYLNEAHRRHCSNLSIEVVTQAVQSFFINTTSKRVTYVTQLLDGTFTYFALTVDEETASYLRENLKPLNIFVDTNFVFGLFNMHDNSLNEVSRELVETIKGNNLPFTFVYHPKTLAEIEQTLYNYGTRLKTRSNWSQKTSRVAINSPFLSGIERRYHQENLKNPISPDIFLARFEQVATLLEDMGFELYNVEDLNIDPQQGIDYAHDYETYLIQRRGYSKQWELITHDILLWQTVKAKRPVGQYGLEVGTFFITVDFHLANFERTRLRETNNVSITILPNQLLQLIRPFISTADLVDEKFVETFAVPEFRIVHTEYAETSSKILNLIDQYGVSEQTGIRLLTNDMTVRQFHSLDEDSEEFKNLFESELARENERLAELAKELESSLKQKDQENLQFRELSEKTTAQLEAEISESTEHTRELQKQIVTINAETSQQADRFERERLDFEAKIFYEQARTRKIIAFFVVLIGLFLIWLLPGLLAWQWLANHVNKWGIYIASTLLVLGVGWCVVDKDHRREAITGIVVAASLTLAQLAGG